MRPTSRRDEIPLHLKPVLTADEAATVAGVGLSTLINAMNAGALTAKKSGARVLILRSDLDRWLATLPERAVNQKIAP